MVFRLNYSLHARPDHYFILPCLWNSLGRQERMRLTFLLQVVLSYRGYWFFHAVPGLIFILRKKELNCLGVPVHLLSTQMVILFKMEYNSNLWFCLVFMLEISSLVSNYEIQRGRCDEISFQRKKGIISLLRGQHHRTVKCTIACWFDLLLCMMNFLGELM